MPDSAESYTLWALSLGVAVVVVLVAGALLTAILRTATRIDEGAKEIWVVGKNAANATINLSLLRRTNQIVADVVEGANAILFHAGRIAGHAADCPGCPGCALGPGGGAGRPPGAGTGPLVSGPEARS